MMNHRCIKPISISVVVVAGIVSIILPPNAPFIQHDSFLYQIFALLILYGISQYINSLLRLQFPGPIPIPILGNALDLATEENLQESIRSINKRYGNYVDLSLRGGRTYFLINDVDFCKAVMKSTDRGVLGRNFKFYKSKSPDFDSDASDALTYATRVRSLDLWGNDNIDLFARSNDFGDWKSRRKLIQPAFDQKHVRAMMPKISTSVQRLIQKLVLLSGSSSGAAAAGAGSALSENNHESDDNAHILDFMPVLQEFALDFIMKSSLGVSLNSTSESKSESVSKSDDATSTKGKNDRKVAMESDSGNHRWIIDIFKLQCKMFRMYQYDSGLVLRLKMGILPALGLNRLELKRREETKRLRSFIRSIFEKELKRQISEESNRKTKADADAGMVNVNVNAPQSSLISILVASSRAQKKEKDEKKAKAKAKAKAVVLSDENIMDEISSFMFAGFDTISDTLCILFHHIATHPRVQKKVHDEIDAAMARFGTKSKNKSSEEQEEDTTAIDYAEILQENALPYLSACIRESQRIQPVAPMLLRRTEQAIELNVEKKTRVIPKGSYVFVPAYLIHRNESYYKDPETFMPERWLEPIVPDEQDTTSQMGSFQGGQGDWKLKPVPNGLFYAFGGGPKMCVGYQLADKELKMTALGILCHFTLHNPEGVELKIEDKFVTGPASMKIGVTKR